LNLRASTWLVPLFICSTALSILLLAAATSALDELPSALPPPDAAMTLKSFPLLLDASSDEMASLTLSAVDWGMEP